MNSFKKYQKFVPFGCWLVFFASLFALDYFENKVLISLVLVASLAGFLFSIVVAAIETSQRPKDEILTKQAQSFLRGGWLRRRK